jgi:hypothetical protein
MFKIKSFTLAAIGSLLSAISLGLNIVVSMLPILLIESYFVTHKIITFIIVVLFGVGILLASFGYREIKDSFGLLSGTIGFVVGIISSVVVFSNAIVGFLTPDFVIYIYPPTLFDQISSLMSFLTVLFFILIQLVWGISHYKFRKFCNKSKLSLITSGFFIVSGIVLLSIILSVILSIFDSYYGEIGLGFFSISLLFASIVFWTFRSNT